MATLSAEAIGQVLDEHARLWNERAYDEWKRMWMDAAPNGMTLESPVGTPLRVGWDETWGRAFEHFGAGFLVLIDRKIVCGSEAVAVVANQSRSDDSVGLTSIEHYRFFDDGRLEMRHFWSMPASGIPTVPE